MIKIYSQNKEVNLVLEKNKKREIIEDFKIHGRDTGSAVVQVALLTERINSLTEHFKDHPKDFHSRRGLLMLVGKRKRFLEYLKKNNNKKYKELIKKLNLR